MHPLLEIEGLTVTLGDRDIVSGVSLSVQPGESVALLGANGAGKTTLLDAALGIGPSSTGWVSMSGLPPAQAVAAGRVTACLQDGGLLHDLTVAAMIDYFATLAGTSFGGVDRFMDRFGLTAVAKSKIAVLSGGERRRLQVALALSTAAPLVILDEPTAAMDVEARAAIWDYILEYLDGERALLFSTHLIEEAERYADRVIFLRQGSIVHDTTVSALRADHAELSVITARLRQPCSTAELRSLAGTPQVSVRGRLVEVMTREPDAVQRILVAHSGFDDIRVERASLEKILFGTPGGEN
ncbi:ABC transporter ATP-binding protein [Nocardia pseudobrasiliensis]|uniref:ABC-2 type transport system ATP-binding protein n=1 Tax=Nocardia pseudobrasiliensis TaxID=45979 RepID=A0A370I9G9_9NOCA|nr:ABC transporter ATP-binding protein [Nocardia pseudobrasiliensis]RDI67375.1 ABC-2 type transport system ATP-binding protein [Nocardia pseudobrasiliensis]